MNEGQPGEQAQSAATAAPWPDALLEVVRRAVGATTHQPLWQAPNADAAIGGEDLVQDTLVKVLRNQRVNTLLAAGKTKEVEAIARKAAENVVKDLWRRKRPLGRSIEQDFEERGAEPADPRNEVPLRVDLGRAIGAAILAALARLAEPGRTVLGLRLHLLALAGPEDGELSDEEVAVVQYLRAATKSPLEDNRILPVHREGREDLQIAAIMGLIGLQTPPDEIQRQGAWVRAQLKTARAQLHKILEREDILPSGLRRHRP